MAEKRKDNKGRLLEKGEYQKNDLTYMYRWTDKMGKRQTICAKNLNELRKKKAEINYECAAGILRNNTTVDELVRNYLNTKKGIADSTIENYWYYYHKLIENTTFSKKKIVDVRPADVENFYDMYYKAGKKKGTIKWVQRILSPAFKKAVKNYLIVNNPCAGALNDIDDDEKEKHCLTIEQEHEFIERIKATPKIKLYLLMYQIELELGLRLGELLGLTWKDVDFKNRYVYINQQLQYRKIKGNTQRYMTSLKTKASKRSIPMSDDLYNLFKEQRKKWFSLNKRNPNFELGGYRDFVFISHVTGEPLYPSNVRRQIRDIKNMEKISVDLPDDLSPHTLRHVFITRIAETGCDIKSLMEVSGHSKLETIMKVYNHVDKERVRRDLEKAFETRNILREKYS